MSLKKELTYKIGILKLMNVVNDLEIRNIDEILKC